MPPKKPSRAEALALLRTHTKSDALIAHALSVEAVMRRFAFTAGEDEEMWGAIGLVHDIDYERWPTEHCQHVRDILTEHGWPEEYIRAVESHGWGICTEVEPVTPLERTLYAVDELTGLVAATALVRPSKSVLDMKAKSVLKKWKQPSFAAGVDRSIIQRGAEMLGMEVPTLITETIMAMRDVAYDIGL